MFTVRRTLWLTMRLAIIFVLSASGSNISLGSTTAKPQEPSKKVCPGAVSAFSISHEANERYETYKRQYMHCRKIMGDLVIAFLDQEDDYDMGFLKDVEEVSGFVLIIGNHFSHLNLTSLRVIRGKTLYTPDNSSSQMYGLFVANNYKKGSTTVGLKELGLVSLTEIMAGSVYFYNNNLLCYEGTIDWDDILSDDGRAEVSYHTTDLSPRNCNLCDINCTRGNDRHCWGEGPDMCQTLSKRYCSKQCESRCFGTSPNECCHPECAGGCSGPRKTDCFSCKKFVDDGMCVMQCPQIEIYHDYKWHSNPDAKYAYGDLCVKECPEHLIADKGACVSECSEGHRVEDGKCVKCNGPCPKTCPGTTGYLDASNIHNFTGCTVINGNLKILHTTLAGDDTHNITAITVDQLSVFESLHEITGYLTIQAKHEHFTNLSFLRNLVTIHGRNLDSSSYGRPLSVVGTNIEFLGLRSLKTINNGRPGFASNPNLCYIDSMNWSSIIKSQGKNVSFKGNKNKTICEEEGKVCSLLCGSDGCWGPGDDQCLSCSGYFLGNLCVANCTAFNGWFTYEENGTKECRSCHEECRASCSGENADQCDSCKHSKDGPFCVDKCPSFKYSDAMGTCQSCHENCRGGCTGYENTVGAGACNDCAIVVYDKLLKPIQCRQAESGCGRGFYSTYITSLNSGTEKHEACFRCHSECTECTGGDISFCSSSSCVNFLEGQRCVSNCSQDHYANATSRKCHKCNNQCLRCTGPSPDDCITCRSLKVYNNIENRDADPSFTCVEECPDSYPVKNTDDYNRVKEAICTTADYPGGESRNKLVGLVAGVVFGIAMIGFVVIMVLYIKRQMTRSEENKLRWAAKLNGLDEIEPLHPSNAGPDMSMLRLIKESELHRENIIGSGAFGTVYKGAWKPEKENVKIPVAIKVLQDSSSGQNKELLDEARIMASVDHQFCVRIIAICMTAQMMLVTQLMPLGCLLDYIRKNQRNIGSKAFLNWSSQIAKGMNYLESHGIVHRDLAARNVLVQNPNQVKITDFGLAKLLDIDQDQFLSSGGKMPIKWLALECIQHRIFTHKSDVWSFGVTMWELYTYGQRPYENIVARDIPNLLEKGERLPQPAICTIDVYMIMIKCWMLDALSRPSFHELAEEYSKMARDPGRYLVIDGDNLKKLHDLKYKPRDLLSETDGPEQIMSADEYLRPQKLNHGGSRRNKDYHNECPSSTPKVEGKHAGAGSSAAHKRSENTNSRYSSDPCKLLNAKCSEDRDHILPNHKGSDGEGQVPSSLDIPVKLPLDEDDYLNPSLSSPSTYLEVVDSDTDNATNSVPTHHPQIVAINPGYFDSVDGDAGDGNLFKNSKIIPESQPLKIQNLNSGSEVEYSNEIKQPVVGNMGHANSRQFGESEV